MPLEPWYKVVTPRKEVREGRSFNPDEFAIHLEQVLSKTAPEDYRDPEKFFARTYFTRALREHAGMVLRRLAGQTANTSPVLTLVTQFGGGKTHTLTALYHMVRVGEKAGSFPGVGDLAREASVPVVPKARVAVFVGNAWDPRDGRETPWIDIARQLAGDAGVAALGDAAKTTPPGTEALTRVFAAAGGTVLLLLDEVLNFLNRHRAFAEPFHAFIQNLTVATTGTPRAAAVISLPRSQVEMTPWDAEWQEKITRVVRRVAKDLIANDETEIAEVVRRRLFDNFGNDKVRRRVAKAFADWCFERRAQLPPEWTAVDTAAMEAGGREFLQGRFEACYPFHPATLSVFQRKWQTLAQYQQTRGTLAMLAQWIAWAQRDGFAKARREPLITLGSAPLDLPEFRSVVLGQLGESRLLAGIEADLAGAQAHARALDADTSGPLKDIHRRVGTAILFESSGGQVDKAAHLPELRFALGEPEIETTSIDNAAHALEAKSYYIRRVGADGYRIWHQPTLKKVVSDRRASLDEAADVRPAIEQLVKVEFELGRSGIALAFSPTDGAEVQDTPRLTLIVIDPRTNWSPELRGRLSEWTRQRGPSPRLYPGALVWCVKKPGRELKDKVEMWLAWRRVKSEIDTGTLGADFDRSERQDLTVTVKQAEEAARDEIWASYRYVALADREEADGLKVIDLGAGHASAGESLTGRVLTALKVEGLLNESVGAGYLERNWPGAFKEPGAWPLASLRQGFLNGTLTRLVDPDSALRAKIPEFVTRGDFGLGSGPKPDGAYERVWFEELLPADEVTFDSGVVLLRKAKAKALKAGPADQSVPVEPAALSSGDHVAPPPLGSVPGVVGGATLVTLRLSGSVPSEVWNRIGTRILPKLKANGELTVGVDFSVRLTADGARRLSEEIAQALEELGLRGRIQIEVSGE